MYFTRDTMIQGAPYQYSSALLKYRVDGTLVQTRPVDVPSARTSMVAVGANGHVFVAGTMEGTLPGATNAGEDDVFLLKLLP